MRVDIERVRALKAELDAIDAVPPGELELYEKGELVQIPAGAIEDRQFAGLSNRDFILMEGWKEDLWTTEAIET